MYVDEIQVPKRTGLLELIKQSQGSQLKSFDNAINYLEIKDWREELLTNGIISETKQ